MIACVKIQFYLLLTAGICFFLSVGVMNRVRELEVVGFYVGIKSPRPEGQ
jgi:hypothetical protein